jgi:hypothetical protein
MPRLQLSGEAEFFSFQLACTTDVYSRDGKIETHEDNIKKYMAAVRNEFKTEYSSLKILDVRSQV